MMSGSQLIALARGFIHEAVPDFWDATQILIHLNASQKKLVLKMQKAADRVFFTSCTIPTVIGTQSYSLPDGTLYGAAPRCTGKIAMLVDGYGNRMRKGDWRTFHGVNQGEPQGMVLIGNKIYLTPTASSVKNLTLWYWYFPTPIVDSSAEIDFIEGFEPLIALDAMRAALLKDEADLSDIRVEFQSLWMDFIETYCGSRDSSEPDGILENIDDPD